MKTISIYLLKFYKYLISPVLETFFGKACRYELTCSEYAIEKIEELGFVKGLKLSTKRLLSCQPFSKPLQDSNIRI